MNAPIGHIRSGDGAMAAGRHADALAAYERALAELPTSVPALLGASNAAGKLGRHGDAAAFALRAFRARPRQAPLIFAVGQRLRFFNEYAACAEAFGWSEFVRAAPPRALAEAAVSLSTMGENPLAARLVDQALRIDPKFAPALYFRGNLRTFGGDYESAERDYEAALAADPRLFQTSWMLSSLRRQTPESNHVERLVEQRRAAVPGQRGELYLCYALHKELHDLGDYDRAWEALERAHCIERDLSRYSVGGHLQLMDDLESMPPLVAPAAAGAQVDAPTPIFIIGMFRSGTTLVERLLAGHSQVTDGGETMAFAEQLKRNANHSTAALLDHEMVAASQQLDYGAIARGYGEALSWLARGRRFVTEKLPSNFLLVAHIARAMPHARFLHVVRDPADTCFANLRTLLSDLAGYSASQTDMATYYVRYRRLVEHWHRALPGRLLDVHYSQLVSDPEGEVRRIARHCGLDFEPGMLEVDRAGGQVVTASATQVRSGISRDRGGAWRPYARQLQPMLQILENAGFAGIPAS